MTIRVVVAPDSFKGTMSAATVAAALAHGITDAGGRAVVCPLADGGEGTAEVLQTVLGGDFIDEVVSGPLGQPVMGRFLLADEGRIAVVDTATASGLNLVGRGRRDPEGASSVGTGELLAAAARTGAQQILLGVGGSACTDGGIGALAAIDRRGGLGRSELTVLCDVQTPFEMAAVVYGPQKGADPATVARLTERLNWIADSFPKDPRGQPATGAAGGLSGALWAVHNARLVPGIDAVLDAVGFKQLLADTDLVITGEGCLDEQTSEGKVVSGVLRRARRTGLPVWCVVGQTKLSAPEAAALGIAGLIEAGNTTDLRLAGADIAASISSTSPPEGWTPPIKDRS